MSNKPRKMVDNQHALFALIEDKVQRKQYFFTSHAKARFEATYIDEPGRWKYCIEGKDRDNHVVRIIIAFTDDLMLIITVVKC